jgi:DNA mismatch repair ATPase MutS
LSPSEVIIDVDFREKDSISTPLQQYLKCLVSVYEIPSDAEMFLTNICKIQTLNSFGQATISGRLQAIALLLNYIRHTQSQALTNIYKISYHAQLGMVLMDDITIKNLELFSSSYEASEKYSLIGILDTTKTMGGARYLRHLLTNPTYTLPVIQERQNHIMRYQEDSHTKEFLKQLDATFDIHKLLSTILYRKLHPLPFVKLRTTL